MLRMPASCVGVAVIESHLCFLIQSCAKKSGEQQPLPPTQIWMKFKAPGFAGGHLPAEGRFLSMHK